MNPSPVGTIPKKKALGGLDPEPTVPSVPPDGVGAGVWAWVLIGSQVGTYQGTPAGRRPPSVPAGTIGVHTFDHWSADFDTAPEPGKPGRSAVHCD
ncbi:hypothetical protein ABLO01_08455 [Mycobacterium tuberculosis]|uniref:hypothetical protein n=1 Tax=Mycobacterium tuberculosis TaxID=1773 RepID=UPI0032B3E234